jgi:hypothetical protein
VSRPRFARRVRGRRALTLAFAPQLIIQLSGGCQILTALSTYRAARAAFRSSCSNAVFSETAPHGFIAPLRDSPTDLCSYFAGIASAQFEISRHLHRQCE